MAVNQVGLDRHHELAEFLRSRRARVSPEQVGLPEVRKSIHHPLVGELAFDCLWLQTLDSCDLRLLIYMPRPNSGTVEKIEQLLAHEAEKNAQNARKDTSQFCTTTPG